jgi:hypothetical protein
MIARINGNVRDVPAVKGWAGRENALNTEIGTDIGAWLRQQREARSRSMREQARQLIRVGRETGDTAIPGVDSMYRNVYRWERGENGLSERYRLYYCKTFGLAAEQFGCDTLETDSLSQMVTINARDLFVSFRYTSGRLIIEISGLGAQKEPEPEPTLALVTPQPSPRNYGGRI